MIANYANDDGDEKKKHLSFFWSGQHVRTVRSSTKTNNSKCTKVDQDQVRTVRILTKIKFDSIKTILCKYNYKFDWSS